MSGSYFDFKVLALRCQTQVPRKGPGALLPRLPKIPGRAILIFRRRFTRNDKWFVAAFRRDTYLLSAPAHLERCKPDANRGIKNDATVEHAIKNILELDIFKLNPQGRLHD